MKFSIHDAETRPILLRLVKFDRSEEVESLIKGLQAEYPLNRAELRGKYAALRSAVADMGGSVTPKELTDGGKYGILTFSDRATAFDPRTRNELKLHGDVYLTLWTWDKSTGKLEQVNGLGEIISLSPSAIKSPLVELQ